MAGTLYVVATPIGNLEDITLRALRVLKEVALIAAEDTRVTRKLLARYDIHTPMRPYHQHSAEAKSEEIVEIIKSGSDVALVSDAGTPGISDPGHELIALAIHEDVPIVFIPGANAVIMALVVSGLPTTHFAFDGFPPRKKSERDAFFASLAQDRRTLVFYESPSRLLATLGAIRSQMGERHVAILREATKVFEEVFRGSVSEAIARFTETKPKGEVTLVVEGSPEEEIRVSETTEKPGLEARLIELLSEGLSKRDAIRQVTIEFKLPRKVVYQAALELDPPQS